ncbi:MAG TPA: hypothetical protein VGP93_02465 [Polyangiaceae bacterium]|nr:hypothetical protein [Polyangiaceae bacterium]
MKNLSRITAAMTFCLLVWLVPTSRALADEDDTATSMARERFKEGVQYFDQKQYDKARVAFMQAYALRRHPAVLLNLAQSELRSGHEADAAKHFSMYLREAKDATASEKEGAEAGLFAAKAVVGEVAVKVDTEGATVFVDGNEEGLSPLPDPVYMTPGSHSVEARKEGKSNKATLTAKAGEASEIGLRLGAPSAPAVAPAKQRPEARAATGEGSPEEDHGPGGGREGFLPWVAHTPVAWVGGGLTVVGIAGGIGFGLSSKQSYHDADTVATEIKQAASDDNASTSGICTDPTSVLRSANFMGNLQGRAAEYTDACNKHQDSVSKGDTLKTLSIVSWVVAGAAAAGTVVYYFVDAGPAAESASSGIKPRVAAAVAPGQGFITLAGSF